MALQKEFITSYGTSANYWSIGEVVWTKQGARVNLNLHTSQQAKTDGKQILHNIVVVGIQCNCPVDPDIPILQDAVFTNLYTQIKELALVEGSELSILADALDV